MPKRNKIEMYYYEDLHSQFGVMGSELAIMCMDWMISLQDLMKTRTLPLFEA